MIVVGIDIEEIEARLGRRLTPKERATVSQHADLALARSVFDATLETLRQTHPADVSRLWGTA